MINKIKCNKIIISLILSVLLLIGFSNYLEAATFSITSGISKITEGKTYTIKITATGLTGRFNITHSSNVSVNVNSVWVENGVAESTITVTAKEPGKATVTISPDAEFGVSDANGLVELSAKTDTVTVEAKPTQNEGSENSDSSNSGSSSSGSGNSSTGSNTSSKDDTTPKPTFKSKDETVYSIDSGVRVRKSYSTSSSVLGSLSEGESLKRTGIAIEKVNGILWSKVTYKGQTAYVSSSYLTTTKPVVKEEEEKPEDKEENKKEEDPKEQNEDDNKDENQEKSNNTNLKTFEVTPTGLSPAFSNVTTEYTMTVDSEVDKIEIKAVAEDKNAKVKISGNEDLEIGTNTIKVLVTAEDGTERTYVITVTKQQKEQLKLSELLIEGLPLEPEFDENVYEYTLELDKNDISELNITATPSKKSAEVEIVGNTELKPGENVITILVKSSDGEEITTYQITAKLPEEKKDIVTIEKNNDLYKYIGIGVAAFVLLVIIIVVIKKSRNNNNDDEMDDYSELYNRRKKREEETENNNSSVEKHGGINIDQLPELNDEDLPKFLRKDKDVEKVNKTENIESKKLKEEKVQEERAIRSKKIDELYAMSTDDKPRRKGKHF